MLALEMRMAAVRGQRAATALARRKTNGRAVPARAGRLAVFFGLAARACPGLAFALPANSGQMPVMRAR